MLNIFKNDDLPLKTKNMWFSTATLDKQRVMSSSQQGFGGLHKKRWDIGDVAIVLLYPHMGMGQN